MASYKKFAQVYADHTLGQIIFNLLREEFSYGVGMNFYD